MGAKPVSIWSDKKDGLIKIYGGIRYLVLLDHGSYDAIYNRIRFLISEKRGNTDIINKSFARISFN